MHRISVALPNVAALVAAKDNMKTLNLPKTKLETSDVVLLVGIGGGYDVFTGLPFMDAMSKRFVLVNSSPKQDFHYRVTTPEDHPQSMIGYKYNLVENYTIGRHGVGLVQKAYQEIIDKHKIDTILAVDGGVDSLSRGDEVDAGTILEDFIGLSALNDVTLTPHGHCGEGDDKVKYLCCAGFGTETEESLNHYRTLENMSSLAAAGGFIGSFSLTPDMKEFKDYVAVCEKTWANNRKSHIQTKIISAAQGRFGHNNAYDDIDPRVLESTGMTFLSLLSSIFWMFDLETVVKQNLLIPSLKRGNTFADSRVLLRQFMATQKLRSREVIPL